MTLLLAPNKGSRHKKKRIGRGNSSGHGTYSTRGIKGALSRTGSRRTPGFEGGQTPLIRRIPKRHGFKNPNRLETQVVPVSALETLQDGTEVSVTTLLESGMIQDAKRPVKILGDGELTKKLVLKDIPASARAKKKILAAGGGIEAASALSNPL